MADQPTFRQDELPTDQTIDEEKVIELKSLTSEKDSKIGPYSKPQVSCSNLCLYGLGFLAGLVLAVIIFLGVGILAHFAFGRDIDWGDWWQWFGFLILGALICATLSEFIRKCYKHCY